MSVPSERLVSFTAAQLEQLAQRHAPGFVLPRVFAGHRVDADTHADLAYTLSLVHACGIERIGGVAVVDGVRAALSGVDASTNPFSSYRVAEALLHFGPFDHSNPLVASETAAGRQRLSAACDASSWIPLLDGLLPRNYAVVLARCEHDRRRLGLAGDEAVLDDLMERVGALFHDGEPAGFIDDSHDGEGRFDIYSADVHLFALPFAARLGSRWRTGLHNILRLVERVAARNGAAITWGRSTGALSVCMTVELGAVAVARGLADDPTRWLGLVSNALDRLGGWFADGLITAHRHRSQDAYRGTDRWLQMTFDCLGKLALAAHELGPVHSDVRARFPPTDTLVRLRAGTNASIWAHRSRGLAFVLPLVGGVRTDYLGSPVNPGLFEVPVDRDLGTGVPVIWRDGRKYLTAGVPVVAEHSPDGLRVEHEGFPAVPRTTFDRSEAPPPLDGRRCATYRVEGRTLVVDEQLTLAEAPDVISLQVAEAMDRPLHFEVDTVHAHAVNTVDTSGMKEYRSFWGELPRVHQIDVEPAANVHFRWSVTAKLRVASTAFGHHYDTEIYRHLADDVAETRVRTERLRDPEALAISLEAVDLLHLHWPEWVTGIDLDCTDAFIGALRAREVRIVWTMHNLAPHDPTADAVDSGSLYQMWAGVADAVLHHSEWGMGVARERYRYRPDARHYVVPHLHWGTLMGSMGTMDRASAERALGLAPCALRLGVVGAPRREKDVQLVLDAFAACKRDDVQLLACSLDGERVPTDERITAVPYELVAREQYDQRLRCIDALVLPFAPSGMLTTGTVGDVVGCGVPALVSDWPYLQEALGAAAIPYGATAEELTACIEGLDETALSLAAEACRALQPVYAPERIARLVLGVLDEVGTAKL